MADDFEPLINPEWYQPDAEAENQLVSGNAFWKPKADTTVTLRFGWPWSKDKPTIFKMEAVHFGIKDLMGETMVVPCKAYTLTGHCPVCEFTKKIGHTARGKAVGKDIGVRVSYAYNILVRPSTTWQVWRAPKTVARELQKLRGDLSMQKKEHFAHPTLGTDIVLITEGERFDRRYTLKFAGAPSEAGAISPPINLDLLLRDNSRPDAEVEECLDLQFGSLTKVPA